MMCAASIGRADEQAVSSFVAFADQCARFDQMTREQSWESVYVEAFTGEGGGASWSMTDVQPGATADRIVPPDGTAVLRMTAPPGKSGLLRVGPPVSGDFAVEMVARTVSAEVCDLSIVIDGTNRGPGFQFGGHSNTHNWLWCDGAADDEAAGTPWRAVMIDRSRLIEKGRWHTVRLEVQGGEVRGYVDGRLLGRSALSGKYDRSQSRQPLIYVYGSTAEIRHVTTQVLLVRKAIDEEQAYAKAFGGLSGAQVQRKIEALVQLLDDEDWPTREGAQELLSRIGPLAEETLKKAAASGTAEQRFRARRILGRGAAASSGDEQEGDIDSSIE